MSKQYRVKIEEPGKKARTGMVTVANMAELKRVSNLLLRPGSKVTVLKSAAARKPKGRKVR